MMTTDPNSKPGEQQENRSSLPSPSPLTSLSSNNNNSNERSLDSADGEDPLNNRKMTGSPRNNTATPPSESTSTFSSQGVSDDNNAEQGLELQNIEKKLSQEDDDNLDDSWSHSVKGKSREAIHKFFYPHSTKQQQQQNLPPQNQSNHNSSNNGRSVTFDDHDDNGTSDDTNEDSASPSLELQKRQQTLFENNNVNFTNATVFNRHISSQINNNITYNNEFDEILEEQDKKDRKFVEKFWTTYDDVIILSLFTQLGIVFRLAAATWFTVFDGIFHSDSPLFTVLPLNCLSCFLMGCLSSGDQLMEIISTRFTPTRLQQTMSRQQQKAPGKRKVPQYQHEEQRQRLQFSYDRPQSEEEDDLSNNARVDVTNIDDVDCVGDEFRQNQTITNINTKRNESPQQFTNNSSTASIRQRKNQLVRPIITRPPSIEEAGLEEEFHSWQPPLHVYDDIREVQLFALERRIRASRCLLLFPVRKEELDVVECYFDEGSDLSRRQQQHETRQQFQVEMSNQHQAYQNQRLEEGFDLALRQEDTRQRTKEMRAAPVSTSYSSSQQMSNLTPPFRTPKEEKNDEDSNSENPPNPRQNINPSSEAEDEHDNPDSDSNSNIMQRHQNHSSPPSNVSSDDLNPMDMTTQPETNAAGNFSNENSDNIDIDQIIQTVSTNVSENISRIRRVNLADGWDVGTEAESMSDDIILGLRDGFCGALSSFSSWNSSMINLLKNGHIGEAIIGYTLGIQLPIVAYRFGQHVAVYVFVWRCRREVKKDERRGGYGLRIRQDEDDSVDSDSDDESEEDRETPSVRAICTATFIMALVTQFTSLTFFPGSEDRLVALSLIFSPLGVLARWRLSKFNKRNINFPIGTFTCNVLACALSGSLGSLLAGNPGPSERIVLVAVIAGFGGTLSSLATFIVEILAGVDPILFRFDGFIYASASVFTAMIIGFMFSSSVEWADTTN